jgi:hypothetical protein
MYKPCWNIGIAKIDTKDLLESSELENITWIASPKESFFADPFIVEESGVYYIFFEEYLYSEFSGRISMMETIDFLSFSDPEVVLDRSFHLSYPYVFKHEDRYYCIPEQAQSGKVVLYEAQAFPRDWKEAATLLEFPGLDPTIIRHNGKWWLFVGKEGGGDAELFLWSANDLMGPWQPHPQNPVKTDVRSSRPGGRPFLSEGKWVRPAQECSLYYGRKLVFNEIVTLSESCYEERPVHSLRPDGVVSDRCHNLDYTSEFCVIDGMKLKKSWHYAFLYLKNKLRSRMFHK